MVGEEKDRSIDRDILLSMDIYILYIMFTHQAARGFGKIGLTHSVVKLDDLCGKSAGWTGEGAPQKPCKQRTRFPAESGHKIVKIDLGKCIQWGRHRLF